MKLLKTHSCSVSPQVGRVEAVESCASLEGLVLGAELKGSSLLSWRSWVQNIFLLMVYNFSFVLLTLPGILQLT